MNEFLLTYSAYLLITVNYSGNVELLLTCNINYHQIIMTLYINKTSMNNVFLKNKQVFFSFLIYLLVLLHKIQEEGNYEILNDNGNFC